MVRKKGQSRVFATFKTISGSRKMNRPATNINIFHSTPHMSGWQNGYFENKNRHDDDLFAQQKTKKPSTYAHILVNS